MLMVDNAEAPFNDPRARQALSYATDREAIVEVAFFGQFEVHPYSWGSARMRSAMMLRWICCVPP